MTERYRMTGISIWDVLFASESHHQLRDFMPSSALALRDCETPYLQLWSLGRLIHFVTVLL